MTPKTIAVDFDGTLVENCYPEIGAIKNTIWRAITKAKRDGIKIILWSCRNGQQLEDAVEFCRQNGLTFDAVNENLPEVQAEYGGDTRKVFADLYIDDRMGVWSLTEGFVPAELEKPPHLSLNVLAPKPIRTRKCAVCGMENHFDITCPYCGSRVFKYGT